MYNPYAILEVGKDATDIEIRQSIVQHIIQARSMTSDSKDAEYIEDMFIKAGYNLLNSTERKKIDDTLNQAENGEQTEKSFTYDSSESNNKSSFTSNNLENQNKSHEELKDVKDVYICAYDNNQVGLFKKLQYKYNKYNCHLFGPTYQYTYSGQIYKGIDSGYIGIASEGVTWEKAGKEVWRKGKSYVANCNMTNSMSFDNIRLKMYKDGKIAPYKRGVATDKELFDVLCYAQDYFQAKKEKKKGKSK